MFRELAIFALLTSGVCAQASPQVMARLADVTKVQGADSNVLTGVGLVTGLANSGDSAKAVREMVTNYLKWNDLNRSVSDIATGGVAMVTVTTTIPPFSKTGMHLDVTVSTINDATSLLGGVLQITKLKTPLGETYGIASGKLYVGGASYGKNNVKATRNHPNVGTVISGCKLLKAPRSFYLNDSGQLELRFLKPSVTAVVSAVDAINALVGKLGYKARIVDQYLLSINFPEAMQTEAHAVRLLNTIHDLPVSTRRPAEVIIDETSGTILAGAGVQISPCAFAVGTIHITIVSEEEVSQPLPGINRGTTEKVNRTRIEVNTTASQPQALKGGATVEELVQNLSALNLKPLELIDVFDKLHKAGYLHAELKFR